MAIYRKIVSVNTLFPRHFSSAARDLLSRLLRKDPHERLGVGLGGLAAIQEHPWFSGVNWEALSRHGLQPPATIRERIYNFEGLDLVPINGVPMPHTYKWVSQF